MLRPVQVINESTVVSKYELETALHALSLQFQQHFMPVWYVGMDLSIAKIYDPRREALLILDDTTQAQALGYHALVGKTSVPVGFVFAKTALADGERWTTVLSHEAHEQAVDPWIATAWVGEWGRKGAALALETDDPVEGDEYEIAGIQLSNFVLPEWFMMDLPSAKKWDWLGVCKGPCELRPGGYISYSRDNEGWLEAFSQHLHPSAYRSRREQRPYSRRDRRANRGIRAFPMP